MVIRVKVFIVICFMDTNMLHQGREKKMISATGIWPVGLSVNSFQKLTAEERDLQKSVISALDLQIPQIRIALIISFANKTAFLTEEECLPSANVR